MGLEIEDEGVLLVGFYLQTSVSNSCSAYID